MKISLHEFNPTNLGGYGRKISNLYDFLNRSTRRWESLRAKRQCDNYWIFFFAIFSKFRKFSNKYNVRNDSKFFFPRLYAYSYFLKHNFITISIAIFVFPVFSTNINTRENVLSFLFIARAYIEKKKLHEYDYFPIMKRACQTRWK